jgi:hypothetical protein
MRTVGVRKFIRRLFSSDSAEEEAAVHDEYGALDREHKRDPAGFGSFADAEAGEAAADELDEFKTPRDPAP